MARRLHHVRESNLPTSYNLLIGIFHVLVQIDHAPLNSPQLFYNVGALKPVEQQKNWVVHFLKNIAKMCWRDYLALHNNLKKWSVKTGPNGPDATQTHLKTTQKIWRWVKSRANAQFWAVFSRSAFFPHSIDGGMIKKPEYLFALEQMPNFREQ